MIISNSQHKKKKKRLKSAEDRNINVGLYIMQEREFYFIIIKIFLSLVR